MTEEAYPVGMFRFKLSDIADIKVTNTKVTITGHDGGKFELEPHMNNRPYIIGQAARLEADFHSQQGRGGE